MSVDIGPKIGIEGERQFRQELQQINQSMKTLASEAKAVESAMQGETDAEKKNAAQTDVLNRQIMTQKDKLELLEKGLRESANKYGEADVKTQKWQQAVYDAQAELSRMENKLQGTDEELDDYKEGMEDAGNATKGWADVMKGSLLADAVKSGLSKIVDLAKGAASAMWDASKAGAAYADDIMSMSATTGLSATALQEYKYMADFIDVSLDTVTGSMAKLTKTMSSAQKGTGEAADAFRDLGVDVVDSNGALRKAEDVFGDVLTALGEIDNETERDAKAMKIFGKSAQELNPLIKTGADRLNDLRKEAHDTGYVMSGSALDALNKQKDAMDRLDKKTEALKNQFAAGLAPSVTKAAETMEKALNDPAVQRGISALSGLVGGLIERAADLAADILPGIFSLFDTGSGKVQILTDRQVELFNAVDEMTAAHKSLSDEYNNNAKIIVDETERTEALWEELQTLVTEEGKVKEGNEERVDFILNQLNDALGTEYARNGEIIEQYGKMKSEIGDLIKMREADALLAAGKTEYTAARSDQEKALQNAADLYDELVEAQNKYNDAVEADRAFWAEHNDEFNNASKSRQNEILEESQKYTNDLLRTKSALDRIQKKYDDANAAAAEYYETVDRYERAQSAMLQGNYDEAIRILTEELGATIDYYQKKKELNEEDKKGLQEAIESAERLVAQYKRNLEAGLTGFTEEGLREMELYVAKAKYLLDGTLIGEMFVNGVVNGIENKRGAAYKAAWSLADSVEKAMMQRLEIQSPSRRGDWIGQMWDEGMIRGLERKEAELRLAAAGVADTVIDAGTPEFGGFDIGYGNDMTASGAGAYSSSSYTTNMGGIAVYVNGAGAVNENELAQRIAVQLTDELTRAQRGGRR